MRPIQLWLPMFSGGAARPARQGDIQRLHETWDRHDIMWTKPRWGRTRNWIRDQAQNCCISGEELECFRVIHVGANAAVHGPAAALFEPLPISRLLDEWLDSKVEALQSYGDRAFEIDVPVVHPDGVTYRPEKIEAKAGGRFPIRRSDGIEQTATAQWPADDLGPRTISPQSEALRMSEGETTGSLNLRLRWQGPLRDMMPAFPSEDDLFARDQMRYRFDQAQEGRAQALLSARTDSRNWLVDGQSTVELAWLRPIMVSEGDLGALYAVNNRFDTEFGDLADALRDNRIRRELSKPMGVRRALGIPGLAWALALDRLEQERPERHCKRCGSPIGVRANKEFCGPKDSLSCYRARLKANKQRGRSQRRQT